MKMARLDPTKLGGRFDIEKPKKSRDPLAKYAPKGYQLFDKELRDVRWITPHTSGTQARDSILNLPVCVIRASSPSPTPMPLSVIKTGSKTCLRGILTTKKYSVNLHHSASIGPIVGNGTWTRGTFGHHSSSRHPPYEQIFYYAAEDTALSSCCIVTGM